jgi:sialidase-1
MKTEFKPLPPFHADDFVSESFTAPQHETVFHSTEHNTSYNSFPSAVLTPEGRLVLAFRQARDLRASIGELWHVDSASRAIVLISHDEGQTWEADTRLMYDHYTYGAQDPCLNLLRDGTILGTFFLWHVLAPEDVGEIQPDDLSYFGEWYARPKGLFSIRSYDGGVSWDKPLRVVEGSMALRGKGLEMADGSFIVASYRYQALNGVACVLRTWDQGKTWEQIGQVAHPNGCDEPTLYLAPSGKLVMFIRSDRFDAKDLTSAPLLTSESTDGGYTWSDPVERPFYSPSPFDVVRLQSGRALVAYGHRFPPYGIRAFLLNSECDNWDEVEETILRNNCEDEDIGYTTSVQLKNGDIKTFYYYMEGETGGYRYIGCSTYREKNEASEAVVSAASKVRELVSVS